LAQTDPIDIAKMARKKQSLRRSPSASGSATPVMSSAAQVAQAASASNSGGQRTAIESKNSNRSTPPIAPNAYFTSDMGDYKMPTPAQPIAWLTVLWRRYEATFAISMLETVRDRIVYSHVDSASSGIDLS
jgi:hypothetical protein